jgi:coronin-1B/1C/6
VIVKCNVWQEGANHEGVKPSHVAWLGELDRIVTTGFSRMRERKFAVYDSRDLSKPLTTNTLDSSTGIVIPLYDNDARVLYLAGKVPSPLHIPR